MTRGRWVAVAVLAAALLVLGRVAASLYADYLWYAALGALPLWRLHAATAIVTRGLAAAAWSVFLFVNLYAVRRSVVSIRIPRQLGDLEIGEEVPPRLLDATALVLAVVLGTVLSFAHHDWTEMLLARSGTPFGEIEPYFELDLGFYVYWLPVESAVRNAVLIAVLLAGALVTCLYALTPSLTRQHGRLYVSQYVRRHLVALLAALLLVLAWSYRLSAYDALFDGTGPGGAFAYADHHGAIPASIALSIVAVATAALVLWAGWTGQLRIALGAVGVFLVVAVVVQEITPMVAKRSSVDSATERERPYLATRAAYTRRAYGVDRIRSADSTSLGYRSLADAGEGGGVSVWDAPALLHALEPGGTGRAETVDWDAAGDTLVAVVPMAPGGGAVWDARPWSVARVVAAAVDARGEPRRVAGAAGRGDDASIPPPLVVDTAVTHLALADSTNSLPAPLLTTVTSRLAYAWSLQDYGLLDDELPRPRPRIITHREVRDRVARLAPFFVEGPTLTPIVDGDTLYWVVELYATSSTYPLSLPLSFGDRVIRYGRHAATAIANAQSGRVQLVGDAAPDPIAATWMRLLPRMFVSPEALSPRIAEALPPAVDGARLQASAFAVAGTRRSGRRDGHLPVSDGADASLADGAPTMFELPGAPHVVGWSTPVLDGLARVAGLIVAVGGRDRTTSWHAISGERPRWSTVLDSLRRAGDAGEGTGEVPGGGGGREPRMVRGPVRPIPLARGSAYLQTTYAVRADGAMAVRGVAVWRSDSGVRVGTTLAAATGSAAVADSPRRPMSAAAFEARVRALYGDMQRALARGDWTAFGSAYSALGALLDRRAP